MIALETVTKRDRNIPGRICLQVILNTVSAVGEATFYNSKTQGNNMPFLVRVAIALMKHHAQKQVGKEIVYLASIS